MSGTSGDLFHSNDHSLKLLAWNVSSRYVAIVADLVIGVIMLPFNIGHLGQAAYGLWLLSASVTTHFNILDLGYGGSLLKFVAQYRAHRSVRALPRERSRGPHCRRATQPSRRCGPADDPRAFRVRRPQRARRVR